MTRYTHDEGVFRRIPLSDGTFAYARELSEPYTAFYDFRTEAPCDDLDLIERQPVLFRITARRGRSWKQIGRRPLTGVVAEPVVKFHQDLFNANDCVIYDSIGNERPATPEECIGIEDDSVWEAHAVEQRLLDAFEGRPNEEVERARVRLS